MYAIDLEKLGVALGVGYRIEREMPRGGMSRIFLARDLTLNRLVVIKVLPPELISEAALVRFRREIELTVRLQHPRILPVLSAGSASEMHYYVTPFVPGESLRERIAEEGQLPLAEVIQIMTHLLEALAFAHSRGVIHRDVKPGNVLLLEGNAILADFGIARAVSGDEALTDTAGIPGTPGYMPPEGPRDESADLYAVGVLSFEMLTGQRPTRDTSMRTIRRIRALGDADSAGFEHIARIITGMVAHDPDKRPARAQEVLESLGQSARRKYRRIATGIAAVGFAVLSLGAFGLRVYEGSTGRLLSQAQRALQNGEMASAISFARRAVENDATNSTAQLSLARLLVYDGAAISSAESKAALRLSISGTSRLTGHDSTIAHGYLLLQDGRFENACVHFARDSVSYPHDFDIMFGLGECRRRDRVVLPDSESPTGFVFRSGYHSAASAYEMALTTVDWKAPEFVYQRLRTVLYTETNRLRSGVSGDSILFLAYPSIVGDTLAFFPERSGAGTPMTHVPTNRARSLEHNVARLRLAYAGWTRRAPEQPVAHRFLSEILEDVGNISETGAEDVSALDEIRRARALVNDTSHAYAAIQVRQLFRAGMYEAARTLADSVLTRWPAASLARESYVAGLAALTGKLSRVIAYGREVSGAPRYSPILNGATVNLPPEVRHNRSDVIALMSMGACSKQSDDLVQRLIRSVISDYPDLRTRPDAQLEVLKRPLTLALPCGSNVVLKALERSSDPLVTLARALQANNPSQLASTLDVVGAVRRLERPSDVTFDYVIGEAQLFLQAGDSTAARDRVELSLRALPSVSSGALLEVPIAGGIVRSMALAATLEAAAGNVSNARQWAAVVVALWSGADEELQPTVKKMQNILSAAK